MTNCIKCGKEISRFQAQNFNSMCSDCARLFSYKKSKEANENLGWGIGLSAIGLIILIGGAAMGNALFGLAVGGFWGFLGLINLYFWYKNKG